MTVDQTGIRLREPRHWPAWVIRRISQRGRGPRWRRLVTRHLRRWCADEELAVNTRRGFDMLVSPRDYASYKVFFFGDYDRTMSEFIRHHLRPSAVAMDLGTERGWFTLLMGRCVGPTGAVHSFEAYPPNAEKLKANVALNHMHWVSANGAAVSDREGVVRFHPPDDWVPPEGFERLGECNGVGYICDADDRAAIEVPALRLDDYAERQGLTRLDLVKIDIEGAEVEALRGARRTIARCRPVLLVEYNELTLQRRGSSIAELDGLLDALDYDRCVLERELRPLDLSATESQTAEERVFNVYAFPRRRAAGRARAAA